MLKFLYCLPLGILAHSLLPELPPAHWFWWLLVISLICSLVHRRLKIPAFLLVGLAIGGLWANQQLYHRLPLALDKADVTVTGTIASLVIGEDERTAFEFKIAAIENGPAGLPPLRKLRLSWYGEADLVPGETWRLRVRLRAPRGFSNPGAFDYSGWLLSEGISATGYVREGLLNQRLSGPSRFPLVHLRHRLLEQLNGQDNASADARALMAALVLGEQRLIAPDTFRLLQRTGTVHLVVVSGLQIGMIAGLCLVLGLGMGRLAVGAGATVPASTIAVPVALAAALAYSFLAGMGVPVQRSLIMSACGLLAVLLRRSSHLWHVFGFALLLIALLEPLAATKAGFWLSFVAVLGLLGWFSFRPVSGWWRQMLHSQLVVFVCLAPWLIYFQGSVSLWSLPVNLVAIPWISLSVVPCSLLGTLLQPVPWLRDLFWLLASVQLDWFVRCLEWVAALPTPSVLASSLALPSADFRVLLVLALVSAGFMLPRGLGQLAPVGILLIALAVAGHRREPALELTVLDVGQGLATVIQVRDKVLVYDTGPGYSSGFNTGEAVVSPFLGGLGIAALDHLIVSHGDMDHAGGTAGLLFNKPAAEIWSGQPTSVQAADVKPCRAGMGWRWHDVSFRVLWPPAVEGALPRSGSRNNNSSCVLLVERGDTRILLPGDVESGVERQLVDPHLANLTVLVAPHHGSKTSSSAAFVRQLAPDHVVFSAGFNHHFGHPHGEVVTRYKAVGSRLWYTAHSGALHFRWAESASPQIVENRQTHRRYWH